MFVCEVLGKVTVSVGTGLCLVQELRRDASISELVFDLVNLDLELLPLPVVETEKSAFLILLSNRDIGSTISMLPAVELTEVTLGKELTIAVFFALELFLGKNILLMDGIAIAQGCHDCRHETGILIVAVYVGTEFLYGILHGKDG